MTVFISRDLSPDSVFRSLLEERDHEVSGQSLVILSPLPFSEIPACDWIFFSSSNAVRFFFENPSTRDSVPEVSWAAIGEMTAKAVTEYTGGISFTGTGEPGVTAALFRLLPDARDTILFPAALHSRQSVLSDLTEDFHCIEFPVYDNQPLPDPPLFNGDILVFTSPMNAATYFAAHALQNRQQVVAIGETTAQALRELGITGVKVAEAASEQSLAEAVLRLEVFGK